MGNRNHQKPATPTTVAATETPDVTAVEGTALDAVAIMDDLRLRLSQSKASRPNGDLSKNPIVMLIGGHRPQSTLAPHRKSAKIGNLFFEYASNVAELRGVITSAAQIAEFFEALDMMTVDWEAGTYIWHDAPMPKTEFLKLWRDAKKLKAVD